MVDICPLIEVQRQQIYLAQGGSVMRIAALLSLVFLSLGLLLAGSGQNEVFVCHVPVGSSVPYETVQVFEWAAVAEHLAHGDYLGACSDDPGGG